MTIALRTLSDGQAAAFDHDYVTDAAFSWITEQIQSSFPDEFTFLDVGGGKGFFADRILAEFPQSSCVVLDISELLLGQNAENHRKRLVLGSGTELPTVFREEFDLVFFNFALHHFIGANYAETRNLQSKSLRHAASLLSARGRISVSENTYNGVMFHNVPGFIGYHVTASTALAPLAKKFGANTAGCGVCFLSDRSWRSQFSACGLTLRGSLPEPQNKRALKTQLKLALIGARSVHNAHYWLARS